ncbi:MAG: DUF128 domain-containing protein [Candidatus Poribacteria bacterium]
MERDIERKLVAILKILALSKKPLGAREISRKLDDEGIHLTERAVRFHLQLMDERGLTQTTGKLARAGRIITEKGKDELNNALVFDKVGMVSGRMDELSYKTNFDLNNHNGDIILNVSFINNEDFPKAFEIIKEVINARYGMGNLILIANEGEEMGDILVPKGMTAIATVCAITINGILLHQRIPVKSRFGGLLQVESHKPRRFTEIIEYSGSSLDPAEIFIKSKMTSVLDVVRSGSGKVLAGFREIPIVCLHEAENILNRLAEIGLYGTLAIGEPNQPVLQIPVSSGYVGLVILAGLNPLAAVEEVGISTQNRSLCLMMDYKKLTPLT